MIRGRKEYTKTTCFCPKITSSRGTAVLSLELVLHSTYSELSWQQFSFQPNMHLSYGFKLEFPSNCIHASKHFYWLLLRFLSWIVRANMDTVFCLIEIMLYSLSYQIVIWRSSSRNRPVPGISSPAGQTASQFGSAGWCAGVETAGRNWT